MINKLLRRWCAEWHAEIALLEAANALLQQFGAEGTLAYALNAMAVEVRYVKISLCEVLLGDFT